MGGPAVPGEAQPAVVVTADPVAAGEIGHNRGLPGLVVAQEGLQRFGELGVTGRIMGERVENLPVPAGESLLDEGPAEGVLDQPVEVFEPVADRPVAGGFNV